MFNSLYSRLAAVLLFLFALVGILVVVVTEYSTDMYQQEVSQKLNRDLAGHIVKEKLLMKNNQVNRAEVQEIFHNLMVFNPSIEIYLLDTEGNIMSFSAPQEKVKRKRVDTRPIMQYLESDTTFPFLGDDPRDADRKKVFSAARIMENGMLQGYLYIILGGERYDNIAQKLQESHIIKLSSLVILSSLLFALIAGLILFSFMTGRLKRLSIAMEAFRRDAELESNAIYQAQGNSSGDEVSRLTATFEQMAARINQQMHDLKKTDTLRRELVANVSHDLRTPLATLQGYIETLLLKDTSLSGEERKDYLKIAIRHCEHLNKLVSELFELAKLDSEETIVHRESFSLEELVQDVAQKFALAAQKKDISIITNIGKELPFVSADIGLIERVLENLIENALRHTPQGGTISLVLTPDNNNVTVQISDTGSGIPQEELPNIFDRFYQVDKSRKGQQGGAGLGLAIAKRILNLHGSVIEVRSVINSGSTFSFQLPVVVAAT